MGIIGERYYDDILQAVREYRIDVDKMADFAKALGRTIYGGHLRRRDERCRCDTYEMRNILSDFYCESMHDMTRKQARKNLRSIFKNDLKLPRVLRKHKYRRNMFPFKRGKSRYMDESSDKKYSSSSSKSSRHHERLSGQKENLTAERSLSSGESEWSINSKMSRISEKSHIIRIPSRSSSVVRVNDCCDFGDTKVAISRSGSRSSLVITIN